MHWLNRLSAEEKALLKGSEAPQWVAPMLATLTHKRFSDPDWIYECKLDGVRAMAYRDGKQVRLLTRNKIDISTRYPTIVRALETEQPDRFVVDGEIVAFEDGVSSFSRLQQKSRLDAMAPGKRTVAVFYYLFDIPYLEGYRLDALPLRTRKKILKQALNFNTRVRYCSHRNASGEAYYEEAFSKGWEGIIAKRAASTYQHRRSTDWLKFKCVKRQELVIGGFTAPQKGRMGFGALLVGYYREGQLHFAGKVGTGFSDAFLLDFRSQLEALRQPGSPFVDGPPDKTVSWVKPLLVGEFAFTEWTRHGRLRHPAFLGLRDDKNPESVVREAG